MNAPNHAIAAINSLFGQNNAPPLSPKAEDAYYAANSCEWLDALVLAFATAALITSARPAAPVTSAPLRAKLA